MRKVKFVESEYYHIHNRGVDKRIIFIDQEDADRFFQSMDEFNCMEPIGSIYEHSFKKEDIPQKKLVGIIAFCLNPNHYHFILTPKVAYGIEKFMQRLGNGYTKYFNNKHKRSGSLFQGRFKSEHISTNEYLLHLSAYVNLNNKVHSLPDNLPIKLANSYAEYLDDKIPSFCEKEVVLGQFSNQKEYAKFAESSLKEMIRRKKEEKLIKQLLID